ncbi:MAG: hypothetical protein ACP5NK_01430 [Thermoplasmata archaeon]
MNLTTLQGYNYTLAPVEFNESGKGFSATFELRSVGPIIIDPSNGADVYVGISYLSKTFSTPYTGIAYYVTQASFSLGNYTMTSCTTSDETFGNSTVMWLQFMVQQNITQYDSINHYYSGSYYVYITPVLFFGPFHFAQPAIKLHSMTGPGWFYLKYFS